ncbi:MAG: hypothetical protein ACP5G1_01150 [Nanopusillaceae archaeon]
MESKYKIKYFGFFRSIIGLMFQIPDKNTIYILDLGKDREDADVHTFFCLKPLDIYLYDSNLNLVGYKKNMKPFRVYRPRKKFRYVIEGIDLNEDKLKYALEKLKSFEFAR